MHGLRPHQTSLSRLARRYACLQWLLSERLRKCGRGSWTANAAVGMWEGTTELWPWPLWAQYLHSFDRTVTVILSGGVRGGTHDETALALAGQMAAVAWLAYFTSTMVQLVTNLNASSEHARAKIMRVNAFCRHARIPSELNHRVKAHLEHVLLAKKLVRRRRRRRRRRHTPHTTHGAPAASCSPPADAHHGDWQSRLP